MTIPVEYETASADFARFMRDVTEITGLPTSKLAWGTLLGVLDVFRRRVTLEQALLFAKALPPILRAIFIADLHPTPPVPFADRATLASEVRQVHRDHQFATATAIEDIAVALRRHVDLAAFDRALTKLPPAARVFWSVDPLR